MSDGCDHIIGYYYDWDGDHILTDGEEFPEHWEFEKFHYCPRCGEKLK